MIELFIFFMHIFAALYAFTKNWVNSGLKDGFLALAVFALMFIIGWAFTGTLAYSIYPSEWKSNFFNHNTLALVMLAIPETFFFYQFFYKGQFNRGTKIGFNKQEVMEIND